jgi:hypothetical protein
MIENRPNSATSSQSTYSSVPPLLGNQAMLCAAVAALLFAGLVLSAILTQGYGSLLDSDAQHFYRIAADPFGTGRALQGGDPGAGTAYRYGRILYPLLVWIVALGHPTWIDYTLPLVYIASVWLVVALACEWCREMGKPAVTGLGILFLPSVAVITPKLVPEFLIAGLILLMYRFARINRLPFAWITAALLVLTRETAVLAIMPLVLASLVRRQYAAAFAWVSAVLPLLLWWTWVRYRIGLWPFLDPVNAYNQPLDIPFRGFLAAVWYVESSFVLRVTAIVGWVTIGLAYVTHRDAPCFPLTTGAISMALLIVIFGPGQAELPAEAFRLMMPAQILIAVAFLSGPRVAASSSRVGA